MSNFKSFLILILLIAGLVGLTIFIQPNKGTVYAQTATTFTFGAAGDYANGSNFQATATQVGANNLNFQLALGDLAYSTVEQSWCNTFKSKLNNILIVSGNHDSGESSGVTLIPTRNIVLTL